MSTASGHTSSTVDLEFCPQDLVFSSPSLVRDFDERFDSSLEEVDRDRLSKVTMAVSI